MTTRELPNLLSGKKGLVLGVANGNSIGYGAALAFHRAGAELMLTYGRPNTEQYVRPLLGELGAPDLLHAIAYAPRKTYMAAWWTVRVRASGLAWRSPAIRSFGSQSLRSRS